MVLIPVVAIVFALTSVSNAAGLENFELKLNEQIIFQFNQAQIEQAKIFSFLKRYSTEVDVEHVFKEEQTKNILGPKTLANLATELLSKEAGPSDSYPQTLPEIKNDQMH